MKKFLFLILIVFALSACNDENSSAKKGSLKDDDRIEQLISSIQPAFNVMRDAATGKDDIRMISYEVAKDRESGEITLINFQEEPFFPIDGREEYAKIAGDKYTVDCTINGKTSSKDCDGKFSCGSAIADCLNSGGCATICQSPKPYSAIRNSDIEFFASQGVDVRSLQSVKDLPAINLDKSRAAGTLSTVKVYALIQ